MANDYNAFGGVIADDHPLIPETSAFRDVESVHLCYFHNVHDRKILTSPQNG